MRNSREEGRLMRRAPSYIHGATNVPLLGETIGDNLRRTVNRFGEREALVASHQVTEQLTASSGTRRAWPRADCSRVAFVGETESESGPPTVSCVVVQYAAARIGAILVNI